MVFKMKPQPCIFSLSTDKQHQNRRVNILYMYVGHTNEEQTLNI